ncbi:hypothetical protein ACJX0J_009214 [Zea mays]
MTRGGIHVYPGFRDGFGRGVILSVTEIFLDINLYKFLEYQKGIVIPKGIKVYFLLFSCALSLWYTVADVKTCDTAEEIMKNNNGIATLLYQKKTVFQEKPEMSTSSEGTFGLFILFGTLSREKELCPVQLKQHLSGGFDDTTDPLANMDLDTEDLHTMSHFTLGGDWWFGDTIHHR